MRHHNLQVTGSVVVNGLGVATASELTAYTASTDAKISTLQSFTASTSGRLNSLETTTSSLATTGSNTFFGTQIFSGAVYIANNLVVQGSSSLQNITASAVSIGTNTVILNTDNPSVRFGGISVVDSGSVSGKSGSLYFDSTDDEWVFIHQGNTAVTSSIMITGPETYDNIGNETKLTTNRIPKSTNNFHIVDSCIFDNGGCIGIGTSSPYSTLTIGNSDDTAVITPGGNNTHLTFKTIGGGGAFRVYSVGGTTGNVATTESFRVSPNGNVGINAVSPNVKLEVCGTGLFTDNSVYVGGCGGQLRIVKNAASTPATMTIFGYDNLSVNQAAGAIDFDLQLTGTCGQTAASIRALNADANESSAHIAFYTATNTGVTRAGAAGTERLRITCDGRIGIGTTTPGALLAVHASSGVNGFGFFMGGAGTTLGGIKVGNDVTTYGSLYFDNATNDVVLLQEYPLGNLRLGTNSGEKMRITNSGNVIIGNTTAYGGLTVSDFSANDGNDAISLFYRGTSGGHQSLIKFYDFRGQVNASLGNELEDDTAGTPRARMVFKTSNGGSPIERLRITSGGCIMLCNNNLPLASISNFGYSASYQVLTLGNTNNGQTKSLAFGVDVSGNASGAFSGYGNEYIWRCAGSFITPNSANNGYNTLLGWNTTGCISFPNAICTPTISITSNPIGVEYLVIAGGGGGGWDVGGGGGAGGVLNGSTGIWPGTYNIGIGGGGPGKSGGGGVSTSQNGYNTYAIGLTAIGGGGGGNYNSGHGSSGGSGGGGAGYGATTNAGFGMKGQGFEGGCGKDVGGNQSTGGGGGGAGGVGPSSVVNIGGSTTGGVGIISTIIGEHRSYGCGGRGGGDSWSGPMNTGTANTGNGGDGAGVPNEGCAGGSGIVILKMKNSNSATFSGGLTTYTCTNVACYNIYVVTAGAGTVTIS